MKKRVIALALGGLFAVPAFAQSNVTVSGMIAVSYNNHKLTDTARIASTENRLDDNSSRFIIGGTEDLGGGLQAYFRIENRFSPDTRPNSTFGSAQGLADGESFVGLKSKDLGSIGFGKYQLYYHETGSLEAYRAQQTQLLAGQNILSQVNTTKLAGGTRVQNTIKYDTPNWNGFSGKFAYSFSPFGNEGTTTNTGANGGASNQYGGTVVAATNNNYNAGYAWTAGGAYKSGPINATLGYFTYKPENDQRSTGQEAWRLGFGYTFPFGLTLGVAYDDAKVKGATSGADTKRTAWMIPVNYQFGQHGVYFAYAKANSPSGQSDASAQNLSLAYDYALSKRTIVGASYVELKNDRNARYRLWNAGYNTQGGSEIAVNGEDSRVFSLNLTHYF